MQLREDSFHGPRPSWPTHPKQRVHRHGFYVRFGSGNHFLEVGYVAETYDEEVAQVVGLALDQVTVIIHCGSRGFGYRICSDYQEVVDRAVKKYGIPLADRQLACAPVNSPEGQN